LLGIALPFLTGGLFFVNNFPGVEAGVLAMLLFNFIFGSHSVHLRQSWSILIPVLLLMVTGLAGNLMSPSGDYVSVASFLAKFFVFFGIVFANLGRGQIRALLYGYIVGAAVSSVLMALNLTGYIDINPSDREIEIRQSAFMGDPNIVASFLVFALMLAHQFLMRDAFPAFGRWGALLRWTILSVIFLGILLSFSRAAWINLAISVTLYVFLMRSGRKRERKSVLPAAAFLVAAVLAVVTLRSFTPILDPFFDRFDPGLVSEATDMRVRTQSQVFDEIVGSSALVLIFGHGSLSSSGVTGMNPHLTLYQVMYELGLMAVMLILICAIATLRRALRFADSEPAILAVLFPCFVGLVVNSLAVDTFYWRLPWLMMALVAIVTVSSRLPVGLAQTAVARPVPNDLRQRT
jgi:O-antigen ligase